MRFPGFIGPSYTMRSVNVDCQRCINLYPELDETGTGKEREVASLVGTPGLQLLISLGDGPIRGIWKTSTNRLFVVSGNTLYELSSSWASATIGTLATASGQVSIADNGLQLVVVDGPSGYSYDFASSTFTQIVDDTFPGATQVTYQDGYFIFSKPNSGQFFISGLEEVTFDGADVASSEGNPDNLIAIMSVHRDLWLFNDQTTEVFYDSGAADFPFERVQGSFIEQGCAAAFSVSKIDNTVFWLGKNDHGSGIVFMANGYVPQRISTHAVEIAISSYGDVSGAVAFSYQQDGHSFYQINFPSAATSWVYDTTTKLWHERTYLNQGLLERHRANCHTYAFSTHVVGDYANGNIYALKSDCYTDNGTPIFRQRVAPHVSQNMLRNFHSSFQLDIESGVGLDGLGQGTDPVVIMKFSDDGGHRWSNENWTGMGKIGQTRRRALWRRLGSSRDRVYSVTITDPVKVIIIGAELNLIQGAS